MKKTHKKISKNLTYSRHLLKSGYFGFKVLSDFRLTTEQYASLERFLKWNLKNLVNYSKECKVWTFIQFNKTLTKLSLESRMGKGKGSVYTEVLFLKKGSIIYEFKNITYQQIREVFNLVKKKIPAKLLLISKN